MNLVAKDNITTNDATILPGQTFSCDDKAGARLVELGVATEAGQPGNQPDGFPHQDNRLTPEQAQRDIAAAESQQPPLN